MEHQERTILKFRLFPGETTIPLPVSALPLHVDMVVDEIFLWVEVPFGDEEAVDRTFRVYLTGAPQHTDVCHNYLGSVIGSHADLEWHVYATHTHTPDDLNAFAAVSTFVGEMEIGG